MSRGGFKIHLDAQRDVTHERSSGTPSWMREFASIAQSIVEEEELRRKNAVTPVNFSSDRESIYETMYSIMNGRKPLYSSVEEAVADYQSKTGLLEHLNSIKAQEEDKLKSCAEIILSSSEDEEKKNHLNQLDLDNGEIELFKTLPESKDYIDSIVKNNPNSSIPSILTLLREGLVGLPINPVVFDDPDLARYINSILASESKNNNSDLRFIGFVNDSTSPANSGDTDALEILRKNVR